MFAQAAIQSLQSKESCRRRRRGKKRKGGMYPGQAFLFISRLADSGGVSSTLYSTALCIFHIESPFMFYVRQLRGEQLCGRRILCKFRRREKERERGLISVGEVEQNAKRTCEQTVAARPRPCLSYYITIIHGDNSSHGPTVVI